MTDGYNTLLLGSQFRTDRMSHMMLPENLMLALFGLPGHGEILILLLLGLLIFGRRLPEVGRSIGRSIVEFKKGIKGIEDEVEEASSGSDRSLPNDSARGELPRETSVGGEEKNPYAPREEAAAKERH
jgi:sec-independent protein translocase protein TatA